MKLPPNPDKLNQRRALWARKAIETFEEQTGTERADALCDLLCDLAHFADRHGFDFEKELHRAAYHYSAETRAKGQSFNCQSVFPAPPL